MIHRKNWSVMDRTGYYHYSWVEDPHLGTCNCIHLSYYTSWLIIIHLAWIDDAISWQPCKLCNNATSVPCTLENISELAQIKWILQNDRLRTVGLGRSDDGVYTPLLCMSIAAYIKIKEQFPNLAFRGIHFRAIFHRRFHSILPSIHSFHSYISHCLKTNWIEV